MGAKREIFLAAINHRESGAVPVDFGATTVTGMHIYCVDGLRKYYGLEKRPVKLLEPYQMLGLIEDDLAEALGVSVYGVTKGKTLFGFKTDDWKERRLDNGLDVLVPGGFNTTRDAAGNTYLYPDGDTAAPASGKMPPNGFYFDAVIRQQPIDEDKLSADDNLEEFGYTSDENVAFQLNALRALRGKDAGVMTNLGGTGLGDIAHVPAVQLKHPKGIRDVAEWYISLTTRKDLIHEIFDRQTDIALSNLKKYRAAIGDLPDVVFICGTDFGTQASTFCSKETFMEMYAPYYKKVTSWIHENTDWKTFKHTCGAVADFIPLFIDAGFDIINPVQCSCLGMEPEKLKTEYGRDIVFWGGGIDTQRTLPFGTPNDVRSETLGRLEIFSKGGGYVFNAIHNVQGDTPIPNVVAMIDAVKEFNGDK